MVDTGMNRLGLSAAQVAEGLLEGLDVDTLHSHLASADEDGAMNSRQLETFMAVAAKAPARRLSLANSAGICLGPDYVFDLTRPGLALYGGVPRPEAVRSEEHTSELQSLMRISYAVFCLTKTQRATKVDIEKQ